MFDVSRYFSIQVFFIILRETLETAIIISVLLSFINKREPQGDSQQAQQQREANKKLRLQVFLGAIGGFLVCLFIGIVFILCFYFIETDLWSYTERLWEGIFCLLSSMIITIMGVGLLRINKIMKVKWWIKLGDAYATKADGAEQTIDTSEVEFDELNGLGENPWEGEAAQSLIHESDGPARTSLLSSQGLLKEPGAHTNSKNGRRKGFKHFKDKYFLAILPFVTTLREGLEAVVFVGGVGVSQSPRALPLAILGGLSLGCAIGYSLYKGGNKLSLQYFLIASTCFLYIVSAGLMSRGVWFLELERFVQLCGLTDVAEAGSGPGSYDIAKSVWHVNCCDGLHDGWWMVANALVGWTNSATYGSVLSYIGYWALVSWWLRVKLQEERKGYLTWLPIKWQIKRIRKKIKLYEARRAHGTDLEELNVEREAEAEAMM